MAIPKSEQALERLCGTALCIAEIQEKSHRNCKLDPPFNNSTSLPLFKKNLLMLVVATLYRKTTAKPHIRQ